MALDRCEGCIHDGELYQYICVKECKRYKNTKWNDPIGDIYPDREDKYQKVESSVKTLAISSKFKS